ncbi:PREDICTED: pentatricopeptide repeat-containing protein At4g35130, chloroplastic isoform X2 [Tarenaya hassleriana]|uniref:pentatricopeptide repeat-containing protein At4g35130, chloroplastic isoform X1 n=1 Tax=Tarenaya hassleriana TaxID=28532 RepID=UPI00053C7631|nr:PREDICTED: pentatricopeptide repeat-containing protein At4g35130, chloroplastic isoform X1 [Tarenaya hassleriana]XP_010530932.1 PREDICTED: pentatricopeptide repeat-containing protein At4g35130, chloroplastic isoform X2 [Tarenaya hassleriana]
MAAAILQVHHLRICNSNACRRVSSENNRKGNGNRNPDIVIEPRKLARMIHRNQSKPRKANDPALTRSLLAFADSDALHLFDEMNKGDPFAWNVMIRGFANCGLYQESVEFYRRMVFAGIQADSFTYPFVIKSFAGMSSLDEGEKVHGKMIKLGFDSDVYICNSLISLYMKLGCNWAAEKVFEEMPERDTVSWNSMLSGYLVHGDGLRSLMMFREMLDVGLQPDRFSIISAIGACSLLYCLKLGKEIHCQVMRNAIDMDDIMVKTSILDMYSKCGEVGYVERIFNDTMQRNIVAWNVMVGCYAQNGRDVDAFLCLSKMSEEEGLDPDDVTLIQLLPVCALLEGKSVHGYAIRRGFLPHLVLESALIDMYGECGNLESAEVIFARMIEKNLVSWNSFIAAYVRNGKNFAALESFLELWGSPLEPDSTTFATILPAYVDSGSLGGWKQLHGCIVKSGFCRNTIISNSLVHMYAMGGDLENARKCFDSIMLKDVVSWNSIIMAYAVHGFGRISIDLFSKMITTSGVNPNKSTFASVLAACSISGMIDEGWEYFNSMKREYGIDPGIEHYVYMLDLVGRSGNLGFAKRFIEEMPISPTARIWGSLLNASRNHDDIAMAEFAAEQIFLLDHDNTGCYVLLSNMYVDAGRSEDVKRVKLLMKNKGISRTMNRSFVESKGKTHIFENGDSCHVERNAIYNVLDVISRMIGEGESSVRRLLKFRPENLVKSRGNSPERHSVRLATCFGLISTATGKPVLLRNNTRICKKCHEFLEKVSRITRREIVVGDSKIFHHFFNGGCSCGNYW